MHLYCTRLFVTHMSVGGGANRRTMYQQIHCDPVRICMTRDDSWISSWVASIMAESPEFGYPRPRRGTSDSDSQ
jgi:hypothetical protein